MLNLNSATSILLDGIDVRYIKSTTDGVLKKIHHNTSYMNYAGGGTPHGQTPDTPLVWMKMS